MLRAVLLLLALLALAGPAFGAGADLSVGACPGNPGASTDGGALDCAAGQALTLLVTFMPSKPYPDLVGMEGRMTLAAGGDLNTSAAFWEFGNANPEALSIKQARPAANCPNYSDTWTGFGSGNASRGEQISASQEGILFLAYRATAIPAVRDQRFFGAQVVIDTHSALEAGGSQPGCSTPLCISLNYAHPATMSDGPIADPLETPSVFGNVVTVNGGSVLCGATPAQTHTWGRLKALYR